MVLTGENRRIWTESCPNANLSATKTILSDLGASPDLRDEKFASVL
jgi:hypothetical protein